jgi:hypothetical protein
MCLVRLTRRAGATSDELPKHERVAGQVDKRDYKRVVRILRDLARLHYIAGGSGGGSRYFLSQDPSLAALAQSLIKLGMPASPLPRVSTPIGKV